jgi:vitamin B12 transporter
LSPYVFSGVSRFSRVLVVLFLMALPRLVWAEDQQAAQIAPTPIPFVQPQPVYTLEEITVYGEPLGISEKQLSKGTIEDIHNSGEIGESLDHESGLETQGEGNGKTWNTLAIRGQSFRETLVLVDGVRMPESFNLGTIPTENIERLEVIEGPQALAFGPDAIGGVINIITRKTANNPFRFQVSGGDFNTYQLQASTPSFGSGDFQNILSGSWYTTDGYQPAGFAPFNTDEVHWDLNHAASLNLEGDKITLSTDFFRQLGGASDADNIVAAGTDQYDLDGRQESLGVGSVLKEVHTLGAWQMSSSLYANYSDVFKLNPIGADVTSGVYGPYHNQYGNYGGQLYFSGPVDNGLPVLTLGAEIRSENLWSGLFGAHQRGTFSLVGGGTLKLNESMSLDLANRLESYDGFGLVDNPTGTLVFLASKDWKIHVSGGTGYKVPSYDELYLPSTDFTNLSLAGQFRTPNNPDPTLVSPASFGNGQTGNPNLKPERSISTEVGTDFDLGGVQIQLSGFANIDQDLINPALNAVTFWTYVNVDHALFAGTEDSLKVKLANWLSPYTSFTWISSTDQNGNPLVGRLRLKFVGGVDFKPETQWSLNVNVRYVDRNPLPTPELIDLGVAPQAGAYWDLNVGVKYDISEHLKGFMTVNNLTNSQTASLQGLPLRGRFFEGGLRAQF